MNRSSVLLLDLLLALAIAISAVWGYGRGKWRWLTWVAIAALLLTEGVVLWGASRGLNEGALWLTMLVAAVPVLVTVLAVPVLARARIAPVLQTAIAMTLGVAALFGSALIAYAGHGL